MREQQVPAAQPPEQFWLQVQAQRVPQALKQVLASPGLMPSVPPGEVC